VSAAAAAACGSWLVYTTAIPRSAEAPEQGGHPHAVRRIELARGLVEQQQRRLLGDCCGPPASAGTRRRSAWRWTGRPGRDARGAQRLARDGEVAGSERRAPQVGERPSRRSPSRRSRTARSPAGARGSSPWPAPSAPAASGRPRSRTSPRSGLRHPRQMSSSVVFPTRWGRAPRSPSPRGPRRKVAEHAPRGPGRRSRCRCLEDGAPARIPPSVEIPPPRPRPRGLIPRAPAGRCPSGRGRRPRRRWP